MLSGSPIHKSGITLFDHCLIFTSFGMSMSEKKGVHKENALLQRGIFTTTDFESFQKSEVVVG